MAAMSQAAINAKFEAECEDQIAAYKALQGHITQLQQSKGSLRRRPRKGLRARAREPRPPFRRFLQQQSENEMVQKELELADEGAAPAPPPPSRPHPPPSPHSYDTPHTGNNVYKLVGPVLFNQDLGDVKENVNKRLEFIQTEIDKVDAQFKAKSEEQQKIGEVIMAKQNDMRQKAAEEAQKVYQEQIKEM